MRAVKVVRSDDEEKRAAAVSEYKMQKTMKHPNIIEVNEQFFDSIRNTMYTVMEIVEGPSLEDYVQDKQQNLMEAEVKVLFK